jgi:hypothetical protein
MCSNTKINVLEHILRKNRLDNNNNNKKFDNQYFNNTKILKFQK